MANINENFNIRAPQPVDRRLGKWESGAWVPFNSREEALTAVEYYRYETLTLPVIEDNEVVEYWFIGGVDDSNFVLKTAQVDLSQFYTKTDLQTPGHAQVHWDNIIGTPGLVTDWGDITGDQSVVGVGGFTNDAGYITLSDLPSLSDVAYSGDYDDLINKPSFPTNTSDLINDGEDGINKFITALDLSTYLKSGDNVSELVNDAGYLGSGDNVSSLVNDAGYLTSVSWGDIGGSQSLIEVGGFSNSVGYITLADVPSQVQTDWNASTGLAQILNKPTLATVATSGSYDDLIDKPTIPSLAGYATEAWVTSQNYLTSVTSSWDVNTGDLVIQGQTRNLDGRYMLRSNTITAGYGITASANFNNPVSIEVNTSVLDNRYLRKDVNDNNDTFGLTLGTLSAGNTTLTGSVTISSVPVGTGDEVLLYGAGGVVQRKTLSILGAFGIANSAGTKQFDVNLGTNLRFQGAGDTSVSYNPSTNTVIINSVPGSGTGGAVTSFNGRDGAVNPELGDYTTSIVGEGTNLYFTNARVLATTLAGFSATNSAISASDTVLSAFGKAQGQISARALSATTINVQGTAGNITVSGGAQSLAANRTWTVNLASVGTAGTYTKVTTDAQGRVTAGAALTLADLPNIATQRILGRGATGSGNIQELTLGANLSLSTSGVLSATDTNTTYTAGSGLTLSGTAFSLPVTISGTGTFVQSVAQNTNGITVTLGTPPNTTYSNMSLSELNTGTATTARLISAKTLSDWIAGKLPTVNNGTLSMSTGTGLSGSASFSANQSGNSSFSVSVASGYAIPTTSQISNWNAANNNYFSTTMTGANTLSSHTGDYNTISGAGAWIMGGSSSNAPPNANNPNFVLLNLYASSSTSPQIAFGVGGTGYNTNIWYRNRQTNDWKELADKSDIPTNYVTTNSTQTGISGNKTWTGAHSWSGSTNPSTVANTTTIGGTANGQFLRLTELGSSNISAILRGYVDVNGIQMILNQGGIDIPTGTTANTIGYAIGGNTVLRGTGNNTILSSGSDDGIVYIYPNGSGNTTNRSMFSSTSTTIGTLTGTGTQMVTVNASGVLSRQAIPAVGVTSVSAGNGMNFSTITGTGTVTMGTPGTLTASTSNAVTSTSHTHSITTTTSGAANTIVQTNASGVITASGGNSTQWNTAYGWGDFRDFGLGSNSGASISPASEWDVMRPTQFIRSTAAANSPFATSGSALHISYNSVRSAQLFFPAAGSGQNLQWRYTTGDNNYTAVRTIWDSANLANGTTSQYIRGDGSLATFPTDLVTTSRTITAGNGLTGGGNLTANRTLTLGTPGTITGSTTNSVSGSSHTHALTLASGDITGALGFTPVTTARTITMTGGSGITSSAGAQTLAGNRSWTISLTSITAGSGTVGALRYNGTTRVAGQMYGGTTDPVSTTRLNYDGTLHVGNLISTGASDRNLKEDIVRIVDPVGKLSKLGGYSFNWKEGNENYSGKDYGVIAQEVEKVLPEIVVNNGKFKSIKNGNQLIGLLIEGFNVLRKRVEELENGIS